MIEEIKALGLEGVTEEVMQKFADFAEAKISEKSKDAALDKLLAKYGAKNHRAVTALLTLPSGITDIDEFEKTVSEQLEVLKENADTKFLFEEKGVKLRGILPADSGIEKGDERALSYAQLAKLYN